MKREKSTDATRGDAPPGDGNAVSRQRLAQLREDIDFLFHEIRTPLTAVINYADYMMTHDLPIPEQKSFLDIICREGQRIDGLLNDFSRISQGETGPWLTEMVLAAVRIEDLLQDAAARFRNASPRHKVRVETPAELSLVRGDQRKLDLVLRNLLANAIKYSPEGGTIIVAATEGTEEVIVSVRDQGIGIPGECIHSIFNRQFRVEQSERQKPRGSGLGLTMVECIIEHHGGHVRVESEPGKGSAFYFSLPKIIQGNPLP